MFSLIGRELNLEVRGSLEDLYGDATFQAFDRQGRCLAKIDCVDEVAPGHRVALEFLLSWLAQHRPDVSLGIVGHQLSHGGTRFDAPTLIDPSTIALLDAATAPTSLRPPAGLSLMRLLMERCPAPAQVACFDSAFHASIAAREQVFALPWALTAQGIRPYGLDGMLFEQVASVLAEFDERAATGRTIVLHLDQAGPSLCALDAGRSVAATSAFGDQDGLLAATRCGQVDPGVVLFLIATLGMDPPAVADLLYSRSGLRGVSGTSDDLAVLLTRDEPRARLAVELFMCRLSREIGALAASLAGLDALVFTEIAGEHAARVRQEICSRALWLGVDLDPAANQAGGPRITRTGSRVSSWVIPTDVDLMIARKTVATLFL